MSITPGWTAKQIRDFVYEYERQPFGSKTAWLAGQGVGHETLRRWRSTVFSGDLELGLVPRDGVDPLPAAVRRQLVKQEAAQAAEVARLQGQVAQLREANEILGKAIGLLHKLSAQEPGSSTMSVPDGSSTTRINS